MDSDNIIAINVANIITITIMAVAGGLVLGLVGRLVKSARTNG